MATVLATHTTADVRNVALVGQSGAGKTTLLEAMLAAAGQIKTPGLVEKGTTVSDFDPVERERQQSLTSSLAWMTVDHPEGTALLNVIDTPGLPDFRGPTLQAITAVETVAIVVNAAAGVELKTVKMVERARERGDACMIVVNKIDTPGVDLVGVVDQIREVFGPTCLPVNVPVSGGTAVVDCFFAPTGTSDLFDVGAMHRQIVEQVVEINDDVMGHYLEDGEAALTLAELHDAFEQCLREAHLTPVLFTSARTGVGVPELLQFAARLLPNPSEGNPPRFLVGEGPDAVPASTAPDPDAHVVAHVFKVLHDPFMGRLSFLRVYQGTIRKGSELYIGDGRKPFRVAHLFRLLGKDAAEIDHAVPGDICAIAKVDELVYDAVVHDSHDEDHWHLVPMAYPTPMVGLAIEATARGQEQKLATALHRLVEEDPGLRLEHNVELNETVLRGQGELHLRVTLARMKERFGVEVATHPPRVSYRETIGGRGEATYRHKKQTGGAGQFGEVALRIEPLPRGGGFEFVDATVGGSIPHQFIPTVEKGVRWVMDHGAVSGHAMQDIRVTVYDGKHHPVDSKEIAFVTAAKYAFRDAVMKATPQVLEPIVALEVQLPERFVGDITGLLSSRRGRISGTEVLGRGMNQVSAEVPLAELNGFQTELDAITGGEGSFLMEFARYDVVPAHIQKTLIESWKPKAEE